MISETSAIRCCSEDVSLIENYDKAIADQNQTWHIHHRAEILPCGRYSPRDLKKFGLYWHRPASELIFLPAGEHHKLHNTGNTNLAGYHHSEASRKKISETNKGNFCGDKNPMFGRHHSEEARKKMRDARIGNHWYTNGVVSIRAKKCPEGFTPGMLKRSSKSSS